MGLVEIDDLYQVYPISNYPNAILVLSDVFDFFCKPGYEK